MEVGVIKFREKRYTLALNLVYVVHMFTNLISCCIDDQPELDGGASGQEFGRKFYVVTV